MKKRLGKYFDELFSERDLTTLPYLLTYIT